MITATLVFDHRKRTKAGKEGPIEIRVTVARKPYYINTEVKCKQIEFVACAIQDTKPGYISLNRRLGILLDFVNNEINDCLLSGRKIDVDEIKAKIFRKTVTEKETVAEWMTKQVEMLKISDSTRKHYDTLLNRLDDFGRLRIWTDVTVENIYEFDSWLHKLPKQQSDADRKTGASVQYISDGGVYNYHKCLKALLSRAERMGRIERNPYDSLRGEFSRGDRESVEFMTVEEVEAFESLHPMRGSQMAVARDLFVFQLHTGMSYADTQIFDFSKYKQVDGRWMYVGPRVKTGVEYITQLSDECMEVLERYGYQLPKINNADYNHALKALAMAAGIEKNLHSHMARHTFATQMLANGVRMENVAKMIGHTNTVQTHRYAKVLPQSVLDDFKKVQTKKKKK